MDVDLGGSGISQGALPLQGEKMIEL